MHVYIESGPPVSVKRLSNGIPTYLSTSIFDRDDSSLSLRAPARETVFRPFLLASPSGALYIERMFFLRRCIKNQFTIFVSIDPYIPTSLFLFL